MEESSMSLYTKESVDFDHKETISSDDRNSDEESGWTTYFEDFMNEQKRRQYSDHINRCNSSFVVGTTNSVVSDAASFVVEPEKISNKDQVVACPTISSTSMPKFAKKLNFKKTRTKEISYDDSLEDTASSPVNSPKIMQGKGGDSDHRFELKADEKKSDELVFDGNYGNCTDLRKRGLCLVPMSMLVNYLG